MRCRIAFWMTLVVVATMAAACSIGGPSLTEAEIVWCRSNDTSSPVTARLGPVLIAALKLDIPLPHLLQENLGQQQDARLSSQALLEWRKTSGYARACKAAFQAASTSVTSAR